MAARDRQRVPEVVGEQVRKFREPFVLSTATGGCTFVTIFATPGWRIPSVCYSHQYELARLFVPLGHVPADTGKADHLAVGE